MRGQIAVDVDALAPRLCGCGGGEEGFAEAVDVLVLRGDLRVVGILPLFGLRGVVVFAGGVGGEQGEGFAAGGRCAVAEDEGLAGFTLGCRLKTRSGRVWRSRACGFCCLKAV